MANSPLGARTCGEEKTPISERSRMPLLPWDNRLMTRHNEHQHHFTPNELSKRHRIPPHWIRGAVAAGELAAVRLGSRWIRIREKDFLRWLAERRIRSRSSTTTWRAR